jgi:hypothetical protein
MSGISFFFFFPQKYRSSSGQKDNTSGQNCVGKGGLSGIPAPFPSAAMNLKSFEYIIQFSAQ